MTGTTYRTMEEAIKAAKKVMAERDEDMGLMVMEFFTTASIFEVEGGFEVRLTDKMELDSPGFVGRVQHGQTFKTPEDLRDDL